MGSNRASMGIEGLLRTVCAHGTEGLTDGQLLGQFLAQRDEAAFAALVKRHGPMVLGVCRRILGNATDAEDAFQATFIVLVRRATSLATRAVLGDWLHGVARRTALNARRMAARRRVKEEAMARPEVQREEVRDDRLALLDEELSRLPEKYRLPIVLCDLEGWTRREAAERLRWPEGTVAGRLVRGRELLARRLVRHGVALSASSVPLACVPAALASSTIKAAVIAAGQAVTGVISANVAVLAEGVLHNMFLTKIKMATAMLFFVTALAGGTTGLVAYRTQAQEPEAARLTSEPKKGAATPAPPERNGPARPMPEKKPPVPRASNEDDRIQPGDRLIINVTNTLPNFPIQGNYTVEANGGVRLGMLYGGVEIKGLTLKEAEAKIKDHLAAIIRNPIVSVNWVEPPNREDRIRPGDLLNISVSPNLRNAPINGLFQVEPSGKVPLGSLYGRVEIKGLTLEEAEGKLQKRLARFIKDPSVLITRPISKPGGTDPELERRVQQLEKEVRALRSAVEELRKKPRD